MRTVTHSWCEDCPWTDDSDVVSRADRHAKDARHVVHTETRPEATAHLIGRPTNGDQ